MDCQSEHDSHSDRSARDPRQRALALMVEGEMAAPVEYRHQRERVHPAGDRTRGGNPDMSPGEHEPQQQGAGGIHRHRHGRDLDGRPRVASRKKARRQDLDQHERRQSPAVVEQQGRRGRRIAGGEGAAREEPLHQVAGHGGAAAEGAGGRGLLPSKVAAEEKDTTREELGQQTIEGVAATGTRA